MEFKIGWFIAYVVEKLMCKFVGLRSRWQAIASEVAKAFIAEDVNGLGR